MNNIIKYTNKIIESLVNNYKNTLEIYESKEGALRLAREYGYGLRDFKVKVQDDIVVDSYKLVCYRFYQTNPPVILSEWCTEICKIL